MEKINDEVAISIIMPVYNAEKYILDTLNKLVKQKYSNYEIILINDGSKDSTESIIRNFINNNNLNWRYVSQTNKGVSKARNKGIQEAKGKYILFLDDDDYLDENALSIFYKKIISDPSIDIVFSSYCKIEKNSKKCYCYKDSQYSKDEMIKYFSRRALNIGIGNTLIKRDIITKNNIHFKIYKYGEDNHFFLMLLPFCKTIVSISNILFYYLKNDSSVSNKKYKLYQHDSIDAALDIIEEYKRNNLNQYIDYLNVYLVNAVKGNAIGYIKLNTYDKKMLKSKILSQMPKKIPFKIFLSRYRTSWVYSLYIFYKFPRFSLKMYKTLKNFI